MAAHSEATRPTAERGEVQQRILAGPGFLGGGDGHLLHRVRGHGDPHGQGDAVAAVEALQAARLQVSLSLHLHSEHPVIRRHQEIHLRLRVFRSPVVRLQAALRAQLLLHILLRERALELGEHRRAVQEQALLRAALGRQQPHIQEEEFERRVLVCLQRVLRQCCPRHGRHQSGIHQPMQGMRRGLFFRRSARFYGWT